LVNELPPPIQHQGVQINNTLILLRCSKPSDAEIYASGVFS